MIGSVDSQSTYADRPSTKETKESFILSRHTGQPTTPVASLMSTPYTDIHRHRRQTTPSSRSTNQHNRSADTDSAYSSPHNIITPNPFANLIQIISILTLHHFKRIHSTPWTVQKQSVTYYRLSRSFLISKPSYDCRGVAKRSVV